MAGQAGAQGVCRAPAASEFVPTSESTLGDPDLVFEFGNATGVPGGATEFIDGFSVRWNEGELVAERARRSADGALEAIGNVTIEGEGFRVFGEDAAIDTANEQIGFALAGMNLTELGARLEGRDILISNERRLSLNDLMFTTCPEDDVDWELRARLVDVDMEAGLGTARGVTFRFMRVPFLWTPYFSFPVDDRRKSGFLTPKIAERDRTGFDLTVPYYLNLAPNYDLLLEPRYMEDRGLQIGSRFRYLLPSSEGVLDVERLPEDRVLGRPRQFVSFRHDSLFAERWVLDADIENVSDPAYFEDLGDTLGVISQTHLPRFVDLGYYGRRWSLMARAREYQTIDTEIAPEDRPYERLPQLVFSGRWGDRIVGFESRAEAVSFDRPIGDTGWRVDTEQELSLRFARAGGYVTPAAAYRQTNYRVDRTPSTPPRTYSRGLPVMSLDTGLKLERAAGRESSWIQTFEPRLLWVDIPFEDQSELPVFDTIQPDFNLVQLFRKYQFVGPDRIADTDQLSVGLTTRLIESASGRERVSASVGQTRYREPRRVLLPDETATDSTRSDYVAELGINLSPRWNLDVGYQWNGETHETVRAETRFEFRPQDDRLFGIGYRRREGLLEQGDLSMIWPLGERWRLIGQYSYSLLEKKALERFAGIEYEACCWRLRLTSRRYIVRSTGQTDSTISIQLELKGLAQERRAPEELLGRGILQSRRLDEYWD